MTLPILFFFNDFKHQTLQNKYLTGTQTGWPLKFQKQIKECSRRFQGKQFSFQGLCLFLANVNPSWCNVVYYVLQLKKDVSCLTFITTYHKISQLVRFNLLC